MEVCFALICPQSQPLLEAFDRTGYTIKSDNKGYPRYSKSFQGIGGQMTEVKISLYSDQYSMDPDNFDAILILLPCSPILESTPLLADNKTPMNKETLCFPSQFYVAANNSILEKSFPNSWKMPTDVMDLLRQKVVEVPMVMLPRSEQSRSPSMNLPPFLSSVAEDQRPQLCISGVVQSLVKSLTAKNPLMICQFTDEDNPRKMDFSALGKLVFDHLLPMLRTHAERLDQAGHFSRGKLLTFPPKMTSSPPIFTHLPTSVKKEPEPSAPVLPLSLPLTTEKKKAEPEPEPSRHLKAAVLASASDSVLPSSLNLLCLSTAEKKKPEPELSPDLATVSSVSSSALSLASSSASSSALSSSSALPLPSFSFPGMKSTTTIQYVSNGCLMDVDGVPKNVTTTTTLTFTTTTSIEFCD